MVTLVLAAKQRVVVVVVMVMVMVPAMVTGLAVAVAALQRMSQLLTPHKVAAQAAMTVVVVVVVVGVASSHGACIAPSGCVHSLNMQ